MSIVPVHVHPHVWHYSHVRAGNPPLPNSGQSGILSTREEPGPKRQISSMRWFRANRKIGGPLALFALALQFCLAFGHLHPEDIYGSVGRPLSSAAEIALPPASAPQSLSANYAANHADDFCAICETIFMLGSSATPEPPQVLAPTPLLRSAHHIGRTAALFVAPRRASFQSRAPPLA